MALTIDPDFPYRRHRVHPVKYSPPTSGMVLRGRYSSLTPTQYQCEFNGLDDASMQAIVDDFDATMACIPVSVDLGGGAADMTFVEDTLVVEKDGGLWRVRAVFEDAQPAYSEV